MIYNYYLFIYLDYWSFLFLQYHVKYIFEKGKIIIKYPFIKTKEYFIKDIIGFEFNNERTEYLLIIYFNETKKMEVSGKSLKKKQNNLPKNIMKLFVKKLLI
jgi:hypothetical protein